MNFLKVKPYADIYPKETQLIHSCTIEYYSAIKRNKIELFAVRWTDLESVIQSEVKSEREKQIPYANTYIWKLKKKKKKNGTDKLVAGQE